MGLVEVSREEFIRIAKETNKEPQRLYGDMGVTVGFWVYDGTKAVCYSIVGNNKAMRKFNHPERLAVSRYETEVDYED